MVPGEIKVQEGTIEYKLQQVNALLAEAKNLKKKAFLKEKARRLLKKSNIR